MTAPICESRPIRRKRRSRADITPEPRWKARIREYVAEGSGWEALYAYVEAGRVRKAAYVAELLAERRVRE